MAVALALAVVVVIAATAFIMTGTGCGGSVPVGLCGEGNERPYYNVAVVRTP